jgi:hypothetical protein
MNEQDNVSLAQSLEKTIDFDDTISSDEGAISNDFLTIGIQSLKAAILYVASLPVGKNRDRANYRLVLSEKRGTSATKHALIRQLCDEQNFRLKLYLAFYEMSEVNMPGVGVILSSFGLETLLEVHTFLEYKGHVIDLTKLSLPPARTFVAKEMIEADQIGSYMASQYRLALSKWGKGRSLEELWMIREECIETLNIE